MQTLNYWKQFEHTGKVEDYLSYVSEHTEVRPLAGADAAGDRQEKAGANPYAGIHMCDRDDIETDAYRGI